MKKNSSDVVTKVFLEIKLDKLKQEIDDNARDYKDEILSKLDGIAADLETMREENIIGTHQIRELRTQDASHERRIRDVEKYVQKTT